MSTTKSQSNDSPSDHHPKSPKLPSQHARLHRSASTPVEELLTRALTTAYWKRAFHSTAPRDLWKDGQQNALGLAVELENQLSEEGYTAQIWIRRGSVTPAPEHLQFIEEAGVELESPPEWATTACSHAWVEVEIQSSTGTTEACLDLAVPKQAALSGSDMPGPYLSTSGTADHLAQYTPESRTKFADIDILENKPWDLTAPRGPYRNQTQVQNPSVSDGGSEPTFSNQILCVGAREGLRRLGADSIDCVVTSPPYRLVRDNNGAETIWDTDPACDHTWETREVYQDTPIRPEGGAGFNSDDTAETLRADRNRTDAVCAGCGGWRGQLGLEYQLEDYIRHLKQIFGRVKRVLKPTGSVFVNLGDTLSDGHRTESGELRDAQRKALRGVPEQFQAAARDLGFIVRERYAWVKPNPTPQPQSARATASWEHVYRLTLDQDYFDATPPGARNVLEIETASGDTQHTAPMPEELSRTLLERGCPDGGVVLDPFCGSGNALRAAADLDREYLGFEISSEYADLARSRIPKTGASESNLSAGQQSLEAFQN